MIGLVDHEPRQQNQFAFTCVAVGLEELVANRLAGVGKLAIGGPAQLGEFLA